MKWSFTKMQGCGNDYLYFDCTGRPFPYPEEAAVRLADRHFGVGGDGIILLCPSEKADFRMRVFNADGSEGKMCGNGARCAAKFAFDKGLVSGNTVRLETAGGVREVRLLHTDGAVSGAVVDMGAPVLEPEKIPVLLAGKEAVGRTVSMGGREETVTCVSLGNPHCVVFREEIQPLELDKIGPAFEDSPLFPERVNTEFVEVIDGHTLAMRVWERGSGETLACGTGACAAAVAAVLNGFCRRDRDITVRLPGGLLTIRWTEGTVWMTGPAETVFEGEVEL